MVAMDNKKSAVEIVLDSFGLDKYDLLRQRMLTDPIVHALVNQLAKSIEYIDELEDQSRDYEFQPSWRKRLED